MNTEKKTFSSAWKHSTQPRKQRTYLYKAPLHHKQKLLHVHLAPALRKKYGKRNILIKKGDKVRIVRGQFAKKEATVERVNLMQGKVFAEGIAVVKKDGTKVPYPLRAPQLMLVTLALQDSRRKKKLEEKMGENKKEIAEEKL